ncbi:MAG TPA: D-glycero-beta-D-manno-heptose 1-phosphate adenylyltransferase [Candidatus Deferrimicrobium sp.]|nr:D-glycero-beta-D-manno-heptose 1-phosphate adenylyltransferase [Candidatus Deferrimicrobium sp.]
MAANRPVKRGEISRLAARLRKARKKVVFTNGVFDIIHRGHIRYLQKAKAFGDVLIVGLNSDSSVRRIKGTGRPIQNESDRAAILLALKVVDYVIIFNEDRPDKLIRQVKPDVLVKGADYKMDEIAGAEFVRSYGGEVKRVVLLKGRSTSRIIATRIRQLQVSIRK